MAQPAVRPLLGAMAVFLVTALALPASGDGVAATPPLFARIGTDDDGAVAPGTCAAADAACSQQDVGGLDLLSLDVREAANSNGTGVAIFLVGFQGGKAGQDNAIHVKVDSLDLAITGKTEGPFNSTTCDRVVGPYKFPGADDRVKALECRVGYAKLGGNGTGTRLNAITVDSMVGSSKYDTMPGTWFTKNAQQNPVPYVPVCKVPGTPGIPCSAEPSKTPFTYTLQGPAKLVQASLSKPSVNLAQGPGAVDLVIESLATNVTQEVALRMDVPATIQASLDAATVTFQSNGTKTVALSVVSAQRDGLVTFTLTSDLGAFQVLSLSVAAPPATTCPPASANTTTRPFGCPTVTDTATAKPAPGFELMPMAALLGLATLSRRRRA